MPATVRPVVDERDGLVAYLAQQRQALRVSAYGLTEDQARATPTRSALSVGGLIKHVTLVERQWQTYTLQRDSDPEGNYARYMASFCLAPDETLSLALDDYARASQATDDMVAGIADLGRPVPVPRDEPWFPSDIDAWSVRWVLLHLIQETARHAGHADIVRESIDGATCHALMAAVEGWPANDWLQPWEPSVTVPTKE
jgi:uncharacterized damage-inducible protein DinB